MFEKELNTFKKNRSELIQKNPDGGFVVINGENILGVWASRIDALKFGIEEYGNVSFLVKNITDPDVTINYTRNIKSIV